MASDALSAFLQRDFARVDQLLNSFAPHSSPPSTKTNSDFTSIIPANNNDNPNSVNTVLNVVDKPSVDDPRTRHNALVAEFYRNPGLHSADPIILYLASFVPPDRCRAFTADEFLRLIAHDIEALKLIHARVGPVALYNLAIIAYHRQRLDAASLAGSVLFDNIEAMDEWLALLCCFLLTDVYLRLHDVPLAITVLSYADKLLPSFSKPAIHLSKSDDSKAAPNDNTATIQTLSPQWDGRHVAILEHPTSYVDAKFCMHIYHTRVSATGDAGDSSRSNRKEAKAAVLAADDAQSRPTSAALLVKARVEQNYAKGLRILSSIMNNCPPSMLAKVRPVALNSLGILHHRLGKHAVAACYFEHSRREFEALFDQQQCHLSVMSSVRDSHVSYNLALQYIKLGEYDTALKLFSNCVKADPVFAERNSILWLRMAECCIHLQKAPHDNTNARLNIEGKGPSRRMVVRTNDDTDEIVMEYATVCARAALRILDRKSGHHASNGDHGDGNDEPVEVEKQWLASATALQAGVDDIELRGAAWSIIAYASLSFDPTAVIAACDELQKLHPKLDDERCTLAQLYAAEAHCMLGQAKEGAKRLAPLLSASVALGDHIREAAYVNIVLTNASGEDLVSATRSARAALKLFNGGGKRVTGKFRKQAMFAAAYVFLRNGETDAARDALRLVHSAG